MTNTKTKTQQEQNIENMLAFKTETSLNEYKDLKIMTHISDIRGEKKPALMVWKGKQKNPFHNYYYQNTNAANEAILRLRNGADEREDYKEKRKAEKKAFVPEFEIGDIFTSSWGYEQTNVDFYQVIGKSGKATAIIRAISQETVEGSIYSHGMACEVMPVKDSFLDNAEEMKKRVGKYGISLTSYASASKWDGSPSYKSWYY